MELRTLQVMWLLLLSPCTVHSRPMLIWMKNNASLARPFSGAEKAGGAGAISPWTKSARDIMKSSNFFFGALAENLPLKNKQNWNPSGLNDIRFSVPQSYRRPKGRLPPLSSIPEESVIQSTREEFKQAFPTKTEKLQTAERELLAQLSTAGLSPASPTLLQRFQRLLKRPQRPTSLTRSSQAASFRRFEPTEKKFLGLLHPNLMKHTKRAFERFRVSLSQLTNRFVRRLQQVGQTVNKRTSQHWRQLHKYLFPSAQAAKNS